MRVLLSAINSKYIHTGLGLRYVGEYARQQGHEVQLCWSSLCLPRLMSMVFLYIFGINPL